MNRYYPTGRMPIQRQMTMHTHRQPWPTTSQQAPSCPCDEMTASVPCDEMVLAMAYVLDQPFEDLYDTVNGFRAGTIFCGLDKPLMAGGAVCG